MSQENVEILWRPSPANPVPLSLLEVLQNRHPRRAVVVVFALIPWLQRHWTEQRQGFRLGEPHEGIHACPRSTRGSCPHHLYGVT